MRIRRPLTRRCLRCGRRTTASRCSECRAKLELERQSRQPYRAAYSSPEYRAARRITLQRAGGRCERILPDGSRCPRPAEETNHRIPLSAARSLEEALALCVEANLEAVCFDHNPRGPNNNHGSL